MFLNHWLKCGVIAILKNRSQTIYGKTIYSAQSSRRLSGVNLGYFFVVDPFYFLVTLNMGCI